jgi:peptidoglycan-associated lipoprotein
LTLIQYYLASELYKKAMAKETDKMIKAKEIDRVALCYYYMSDYKQAENWFAKAIKAKFPDPKTYFYLAQCQKINMKYDEAIVTYYDYIRQVPSVDSAFITGCKNGVVWREHPTNYAVENVAQINSANSDFSATIADADNHSVYFISMRQTEENLDRCTGQYRSKIFYALEDKNGKWTNPNVVDIQNGPVENYTSVSFFLPTYHLFFSCKTNPNAKKKISGVNKLYFGDTISANRFQSSVLKFPNADNLLYDFNYAFIIQNGDIIFSSNLPGGYGGYDLWSIHFDPEANGWSKPENLGREINTVNNETAPFVREDGSLYFSSDRLDGMGGYDLYCAKKMNKVWSKPENMKYPINSSADEIGIVFQNGKDTGYINSNREGGKGGMDIWRFYVKRDQ